MITKNRTYNESLDMNISEVHSEVSMEMTDNVVAFVENCLVGKACSIRSKLNVLIVVEEIFGNIVKHSNIDKNDKIIIQCWWQNSYSTFVVRFIDHGSPFNPLNQDNPDISSNLNDRKIGGLGIYISKQLVDLFEYQRNNERNIVTIYKNLDMEENL